MKCFFNAGCNKQVFSPKATFTPKPWHLHTEYTNFCVQLHTHLLTVAYWQWCRSMLNFGDNLQDLPIYIPFQLWCMKQGCVKVVVVFSRHLLLPRNVKNYQFLANVNLSHYDIFKLLVGCTKLLEDIFPPSLLGIATPPYWKQYEKTAGIIVFQISIILPFICFKIDHEMVKSQAKTCNFSTCNNMFTMNIILHTIDDLTFHTILNIFFYHNYMKHMHEKNHGFSKNEYFFTNQNFNKFKLLSLTKKKKNCNSQKNLGSFWTRLVLVINCWPNIGSQILRAICFSKNILLLIRWLICCNLQKQIREEQQIERYMNESRWHILLSQ